MRFDWVQILRRPADVLPTPVLEDHRGQLRVLSGNGSSTADELWFGRNDAGTLEWAKVGLDVSGGGGTAVAVSPDPSLGTIPAYDGSFTITDAAITTSSRVLVWQYPNGDADELEMDIVTAAAGVPSAGSVAVYWQAIPGPVVGTQSFNYLVMGT